MTKKLLVLAAAVLVVASTVVVADQPRGGPGGGPPPQGAPGMGGGYTVAGDGTVLMVQPKVDSTTNTVTALQLVAIAPTGSVAWRYDLSLGQANLAVVGSLVIVAQGPAPASSSSASTSTPQSTVTAVQLDSGVKAWSLTVDGLAGDLRAATDRLYLTLMKPTTTSSSSTPPAGTLTLAAISTAGTLLWTLALSS